MTISSENFRNSDSGNDSTVVFAYTYKINEDAHLEVTVADASDTQYDLVLNTHYTVSDAGEDAGGDVTTLNLTSLIGFEKVPTNWSITIRRVVPMTQLTDLENSGAFLAQTHEDVFDYVTMLAHQQQEEIDRAAKVSVTSGDTGDDLLDTIEGYRDDAASSASAAATSETNAATSETNADADATATAADAVSTAADAVSTAADAATTTQDAIDTAADVVTTNADAATTTQDAIDTAADAIATAADAVSTGDDATATAADAVSTGIDAAATAADAISTAADVVSTDAALAAAGLPGDISGAAGKILKVNIGETGYDLVVPQDLPTISGGDAYKQAAVNAAEDGYELSDGVTQLRDFTAVGSIGSASTQLEAGHIFETAEPNTSAAETLALYNFENGNLTVDQKGDYPLTNNNAATNTTGIMGTNFATNLVAGSSQYYTSVDLLDVTSGLSNGIAIDFWIKANDGQPAGNNNLCTKDNVASEDEFNITLGATTGQIFFNTEENNNGAIGLSSLTALPNGATDWYYVCVNWDTTNGKRMWINGRLEAIDNSAGAKALMGDGNATDFHIGSNSSGGSSLDGDITHVRVRDKILTQADVDVAYASRIARPAALAHTDFKTEGVLREFGEVGFEHPIPIYEVARDASYIYLHGGLSFNPTDELRLTGRI